MSEHDKASEETLADLHGKLADIFIERIKTKTATPSDLNAARQFLKDNGITCDGPRNPRLRDLTEDLPNSLPEYPQ